jgi:hypothetical protein
MEVENNDLNFKNSLNKHYVFYNLVEVLVKKIKAIPKIEELKLNLELTLLCCDIVENTVSKKTKIDKQKLVNEALTQIFTLTEEEQKTIKNQIEFLYDNGKIVKLDAFTKFFTDAGKWLAKKFA